MKRILTVVIALMPGIAWAADETRSVVTTRTMPAGPEAVIEAFIEGDQLADWWQVTRSLVTAEKDGVWSIAWDDWPPDGTHHSWSGSIIEISSDRLVIGRMVMNEPDMPLLGPMQLEISAVASDGGSSVTVTHSGYGYGGHWDTMYELVVQGWDHVLGDMQNWFDAAN